MIKSFQEYLLENLNPSASADFQPRYFSLPYSIPEDRFENGLLKTNVSRRSNRTREISQTDSKYSSKEEFFKENPIQKIEAEILREVNRVVEFVNNNPLTGRSANAKFEQDLSLGEYLESKEEEDDSPLGAIRTDLPFDLGMIIRVDYDIYKNIPVFTFWYDGDMFFYYETFTLEPNDVTGSGEDHTYITADEVIDYMFFETVWRQAFAENPEDSINELGIDEDEFWDLVELAENPNYPRPITGNYLDSNFVEFVSNKMSS